MENINEGTDSNASCANMPKRPFSGIAEARITYYSDYVITNGSPPKLVPEHLWKAVMTGGEPSEYARFAQDDLADVEHPVRHDFAGLARVVMDTYQGTRRGLLKLAVNG